ncbi:hypothetical protein WJX81_005954 [Elliptochloris bilobata]|uniref:Succinyl-CoA:3-ketoacid-coenzyme A transferase n=1 Tax=Elliptochloris bilobata TaxID=381761 RepID=A0AAW1SGG8_9CHLO
MAIPLRLAILQGHLQPTSSQVECRSIESSFTEAARQGKLAIAQEAVAAIPDGATITVSGFVGCGCPELLVNTLRERFDRSGHPCGLHLFQVVAVGNGKGRGLSVLAAEGLVTRYTYSWTGLCPEFVALARAGKLQAWNLPLGVLSHLVRDCAAGRPGTLTRIGLATFVDPRERGGKVGGPHQADVVQVVQMGGRELLWYQAPPAIHAALLRGTTADEDGNISVEDEAFYADTLNQAMAVHNSGGIVIVQVQRIAARGSLPTRAVHIPGALVDKVVLAPAELHWQSFAGPATDGTLSGALKAPCASLTPLALSVRRAIAFRAMLEIDRAHAVVNVGVGMPEGIARMVATHGQTHIASAWPITLTTEVGMFGGSPAGGMHFGAAHSSDAHMPCASMLDFYQGGGSDVAFLGMAEIDAAGNVNVSRFENRAPGCGGFIDISSAAKKVVFVGTFTSGGLKASVGEGRLKVEREGRVRKFCRSVCEKTFAASGAGERPVWVITERAVFCLRPGAGLELVEVAPGVDLERDVLGQMDFKPIVKDVKLMDARCFSL